MYSGFASKSQESAYNRHTAHLIQLVQTHLLTYLTGQPLDIVKWSLNFTKVYESLQGLETQKTQHPKFSVYCTELAEYFGVSMNQPVKQPKTALKHEFDLTFIQDYKPPPKIRNVLDPPPVRKLRPIYEKTRTVGRRSKVALTPSPERYLEPRIYQGHTPSPQLLRPKKPSLHRRSFQLREPRPRRRRIALNKSEPRELYLERAMWKLNNDLYP